jgi:methylmalonyl-CoA mutase cobalamin-binding domain/chain
LSTAVAALDDKTARRLVQEAIARGDSTDTLVQATMSGLQVVGERYERQEIFLSGLIMAGEIFRGVMDVVLPDWENTRPSDGASGRVLLGTVAGDIHDLGKNMASLTFRAFGFAVEDLGVNVPPEDFVEAALRSKPDIIGMSGLLTLAFDSMRETVRLLRARGQDLGSPIIVIGGSTIDEHVAGWVGADHWTNDAMEGVRICQRLLESKRRSTDEEQQR